MNRLDALAVRDVNGKSYFTRLGVAFEAKDGSGWNILLDAMPAPVEGQFKILLRPPREEGQRQPAPQRQSRPAASHAPAFDSGDDVPFAPQTA